jgi:hypothetical protein
MIRRKNGHFGCCILATILAFPLCLEIAMKKQSVILPLFGLAMLAGCGKSVPQEKLAYVGEWQEPNMYLFISKDGSVTYKRIKNGSTTSIDGPLKGFDGNNFEVGVGPMATTFIVSKPPYQVGNEWKMVVDGKELIKTPDAI